MFIAVCIPWTLIAQSSTEAEFYCLAGAGACRKLSWIRSFLQEILDEILGGKIFQDNTSTINTVTHEGVSERSKHIEVKFHFVMQLKSTGKAEFPHIDSPEMCTDTFTKERSNEIYPKHANVIQGFNLFYYAHYL